MRPFLAFALAVVLLFGGITCGAGAGIQPSRDGLSRKLAQATFALYGESEDVRIFMCTATIFEQTKDGYNLLSAGHCVLEKSFPPDLKFYVTENIIPDSEGGPRPVELLPVSVVKAWNDDDAGIDFSIFHLVTKSKYPVISLGDENTLAIGSDIVAVNFSHGFIKMTSPGIVSSDILPNPGASLRPCGVCKGHFFVQLYYSSGASGSAVVSRQTQKIGGVLVGGFDENIGATVAPISKFIAARQKP